MTLRNSTSLLVLGLAYTLLHKAAYALFPSLAYSRIGRPFTSGLWILATLPFVLFAYRFLRELKPRRRSLRFSLFAIILFTLMVLVSKLPVWPMARGGAGRRLFGDISSLLNGIAVLAFLIALFKLLGRDSPLHSPLRAAILGGGLMAALRIASTGFFLAFLLTGRMTEPPAFFSPLSMLSFFFAYGAVLWFLIRFRRVEYYAEFAGE